MLQRCGLGCLGVVIGCTTAPPGAKLDSAAPTGGSAGSDSAVPEDIDPCAVVASPADPGWVAVPVDPLPATGEGVAIEIEGTAVILARPHEDCTVVVSRICTHQGCDVAFVEGRFVCPCHGAAFRIDGSVLSGPTSVPLASYPAQLVDGVVWVQMG